MLKIALYIHHKIKSKWLDFKTLLNGRVKEETLTSRNFWKTKDVEYFTTD
jgi:hypothetical protein